MGSLHDFRIAHRNHEPVGIPLNRPPGTFSPIGGEGRDEGVRFMGRVGGRGRRGRFVENPPQVLRGKTLLYIRFGPDKSEAAVMDNLLSLLNGDLSIWGVIAMPVGVAICFGPALFMWLKAEFGAAEKDEDRR